MTARYCRKRKFENASPDEYIESREEEDEEKKEENLDSEDDYSSEDDYFAVEIESEAER